MRTARWWGVRALSIATPTAWSSSAVSASAPGPWRASASSAQPSSAIGTSRPCQARRRAFAPASSRANLYAQVVNRLWPRNVASLARMATSASSAACIARSSSSACAPRRRSSKRAARRSSACRRATAASCSGPAPAGAASPAAEPASAKVRTGSAAGTATTLAAGLSTAGARGRAARGYGPPARAGSPGRRARAARAGPSRTHGRHCRRGRARIPLGPAGAGARRRRRRRGSRGAERSSHRCMRRQRRDPYPGASRPSGEGCTCATSTMVGIAAARRILDECAATGALVPASVATVSSVARRLLGVVVCVAALAAGTGMASAQAPAGDIGVSGASYAPLGGSPTGSKPESKLWFNDGRWWASMFDPTSDAHHIFWLDRSTGTWTDTGTAIDARANTRADVLWDAAAGKLYVASHVFTTLGAAAASESPGRLWRFSYAPATKSYSLDPDFPVDVNSAATETLVIDKDSTGVLWATWTQDSRVFVNHTTTNDATWGTPFVVPTADPATTTLDADDISSLVRFGNQIGVMWSNQADGRFYFATHAAGADDSVGSWSATAVPTGASSDDHVSLRADGDGQVYAAVKTGENVRGRPLIQLLVRAPGGTWTSYAFGLVRESHTRPIVLIDEQHEVVHVLATCPQPPVTSGQSGGDICEKTAPIDDISFPRGPGRPVIRDAGSPDVNDVTSTKQPVGAASGLVVMANNDLTSVYWHADEELAGPVAPVGDFAVTPAAGPAPLTVHFTDTSSGSPTEWSWDFGDGSPVSTEQSPARVYTRPGTYDVTLTVTNAVDANTI